MIHNESNSGTISDCFKSYPDVVSINDVKTMLNVGRNTAYSLLKNGSIKTIRIGRKYIIPKQNVIDFLLNTWCDKPIMVQ